MNLVFVDIDNTLADARKRLDEGGPRPAFNVHDQSPFKEWLRRIHEPIKLARDPVVQCVSDMVKALSRTHQVYYLTSREEDVREVTERWLVDKGLPTRRVLMRPPSNNEPYATFKEHVIKAMSGANPDATQVIVIDDDPDEELEQVCRVNRWTLIKVIL